MGEITGVILAAGRGSRLDEMTEARPKCLVELGARPLLDWQVSALHGGGVERVVVVAGYCREMIVTTGIDTLVNEDWDSTNMVASLMVALDHLGAPLIVSYSDIVYDPELVQLLVQSKHELAISYDLDWRDLWALRFENPLSDAETFRVDEDGRLLEIGGKTEHIEDIQGQFMGLIRIGPKAAGWIRDLLSEAPDLRERLDTTSLLMHLIRSGRPVYGVPTRGGWCEIDDQTDLAVAEKLLVQGRLGARIKV